MRDDLDNRIRLAAFNWLSDQVSIHGEVLPRELLQQGFEFKGERVPLVSPQGIFKPRVMPELPLTITTVFGGPYDDHFSPDGLLTYRYRGENPNHRDNVGLRKAMQRRVPLIYFHGVVKSRYLAIWPVYVVGDQPDSLTFRVAVDDVDNAIRLLSEGTEDLAAEGAAARRAYITATYRHRLHQHSFRERVLHAYRRQCALCRLRHQELLDAAHIIPDREPAGEPSVPNGLALCKLHHTAFDRYFLAVTPDYEIQVRGDILKEEDGPMLRHGLQGLHGTQILVPRPRQLRPDRDLLAWRYERFKKVS